ncbi:hypothetical protein BJ742DRAFT_812788 [Cladochytrium replicatum]|nr:hypothetical protein BJ742DRAFT_812788 [Cladochytrium replicatum]
MVRFLCLFALLALCIPYTLAHAVLEDPAPRAGQGVEPGVKVYGVPGTEHLSGKGKQFCLSSSEGKIAQTYEAGQTIRVAWKVTIPHKNAPGVMVQIRYNPDEEPVVLIKGADAAIGFVYMPLPKDKTSAKAVLQWSWTSTEDGGFYLACSDIAITGGNKSATTTIKSTRTKSATKSTTKSTTKATTKSASPSADPSALDAQAQTQGTSAGVEVAVTYSSVALGLLSVVIALLL